MSIAIMSRVFYTDFPSLSCEEKGGETITIGPSTAKLVMLAIADSSDEEGDNSYNGIERLAQKASLSTRSIIRAIKVLELHGYLIRHKDRSRYGTKNFKINLDMLGAQPAGRKRVGRPPKEKEKVCDSPPKVCDSPPKVCDSPSPDPSLSILTHPTQEKLQAPSPSLPAKESEPMDTQDYIRRTEQALLRGYQNHKGDYAHYPEDIVPVIERMQRLWYFKPPPRKGKQYAFWVESCRGILDACGEFGVNLLDALHADWRAYLEGHNGLAPHTINSPKSLLNDVYGKARLMRAGGNTVMWADGRRQDSSRQSTLDV